MTITNKVSLKSVNGGNTPIADVVDAPTIGTATAGVESASVTFTAAATGGAATSYGAISTPGSITGTSATSPITVSGLTADTSYTFKTYGINAAGTWSSVLSAASNSATALVSTSFESIATTTVGAGGSSTITFSSIASTYQHLQLRYSATSSADGLTYTMRMNDDATSNYVDHTFRSNGTLITSNGRTGNQEIALYPSYPGIYTTYPTIGIIDIFDYKNTSKHKTIRQCVGQDRNGSGGVDIQSGVWMSTAAITKLSITIASSSFAQYSTFALYGIKGA